MPTLTDFESRVLFCIYDKHSPFDSRRMRDSAVSGAIGRLVKKGLLVAVGFDDANGWGPWFVTKRGREVFEKGAAE